MLRIGLTGGIGSGKSTVARVFLHLGIAIYHADERAKFLMTHDKDIKNGITDIFGPKAFGQSGELDRSYIARLAFGSPILLQQLNQLVHPAVFADFETWVLQQSSPYVIKEAALLFESDSYKQVNETIVVTAPESLRINRAVKRDESTKDAIAKRMANQMPEDEKLKRATYRIINDESESVLLQVLKLHHIFVVQSATHL